MRNEYNKLESPIEAVEENEALEEDETGEISEIEENLQEEPVEPEPKTLRRPKRVYNLTEEQKKQRLENLEKARQVLRDRKKIRDEYLQSKKEETEQKYEMMKEKTKIQKQKMKAETEIGSYNLQKELNDLKKKLASLEAGKKAEEQQAVVKENLNKNFEKIQQEEEKKSRLEILRKDLYGY